MLAVCYGGMINPGTPANIPASFDCKARTAAWQYGQHLLPSRGTFKTLFDAMQLEACGVPAPLELDAWVPPTILPQVGGNALVVAVTGSDAEGDGSVERPFLTVSHAIHKACQSFAGQASAGNPTMVYIRRGVHHVAETVQMGPECSHVHVQNYHGEEAILTGAMPLEIPQAAWKPYKVGGSQNTWVAHIGTERVQEMTGLRIDGERAIRAKYPNGNMELSGNWLRGSNAGMGGGDYIEGWITNKTTWVPPFRHADSEDLVATGEDWPSVEWPLYEGSQTGEGDRGEFHIGMGGYCEDDLQDPIVGPTGYWCAMRPPRGQCWDKKKNTGRGCTQTHMSPDGVVWARAANYSDPTTAVVNAWRGGGRWFTQMWKVDHYVAANTTLIFDPSTGGQGGEGMTTAAQWWIENVKEECDDANEFFFDEKAGDLYFNFNGTARPTGAEVWAVPTTRVLFNLTGTAAAPIKGVTIQGLTLRDARLTYLDAHGMPSGGDWALQRSGAIFLQGTENVTVDNNLLTRNDGNGVFLSGYNRYAAISNNEVSWHGDTAFAAWGNTGTCLNENCSKTIPYPVGPDGRGGDQPRFTSVTGNLVREIGIWQKQSSMWFQAIATQTYIAGNVHFNGPRAGINMNDGFGGGDVIEHNLLANCVRESGDHGPYNSWDRVPYITDIATPGKASVIPAWRHIRRNFIVSVYSSQEAIDTDDGSAYYKTYENFFVYAANGLKSDFNGHDNRHYRNVYTYVSNSWGGGTNDWFVNNTVAPGGFASDCRKQQGMEISGNVVYTPDGTMGPTKVCDKTNHAAKLPSEAEIIDMGKRVIQWGGQ